MLEQLKTLHLAFGVFVVAFVVLSFNLGGIPVFTAFEANNILENDTVLYRFFTSIGQQIFGASPYGVRFFSVLFGAGTVLVTYLLGEKWFSRDAGLTAVGALLCSFYFQLQSHTSSPDTIGTFLMALLLFSFYSYYKAPKLIALIVGYVALGLLALTVNIWILPLVLITLLLTGVFEGLPINTAFQRFKFETVGSTVVGLTIALDYLMLKAGYGSAIAVDYSVNWSTVVWILLGFFPFGIFAVQTLIRALKDKNNAFVKASGGLVVSILLVSLFFGNDTADFAVLVYPVLALLVGEYVQSILAKDKMHIGTHILWWAVVFVLLFIPFLGYMQFSSDEALEFAKRKFLYVMLLSYGGIFSLILLYTYKLKAAIATYAYVWVLFGFFFFHVIVPALVDKTIVNETVPTKAAVVYKAAHPTVGLFAPTDELTTSDQVYQYLQIDTTNTVITTADYVSELDTNKVNVRVVEDLFEPTTSYIIKARLQ